MKNKVILLSLFSIFLLNTLTAQKIVALHSATGVQFFSDDNPLQSAYTAAVNNDTIYLPGGSFAVPPKFEKKLRIIGAGHYPSATGATWKTILSGNINLWSGADSLYLEGIKGSDLNFNTNQSINNVVIQRCKLNNININGDRSNPSENCIFRENVFNALNVANLLNSSFFNNIIQQHVNSARNLTFLNNIFLYAYHYNPVFNYANNCMIKNNVFLQTDGYHGIADGAGQSTYSHNIVCFAFDPNNTSSFGTDPLLDSNYTMTRANVLVNQTGGTFDYSHDYHLQTAAQANLGDDSTVVGIYGGFFPWKDESIPSNPHISSKNISNTTSTTGTIHIDVNVQAQDR